MKVIAKKNIQKLFVERGYSLMGVALATGLSHATLLNMTNGKGVSPKTIKKNCDYFQVNTWDYFEIVNRGAL